MPRIALTWLLGLALGLPAGACSFDASYAGGRYACSDGVCPQGLACSAAKLCVAPGDGGGDGGAGGEGAVHALTCSDPDVLAPAGGSVSGTTAGRFDNVSASCGGVIANGPDAVYAIDLALGAQLTVSISGSYSVAAYVIAPCIGTPGTPLCVGNMAAMPGDPLTVTTNVAGTQYVVVDAISPVDSGTYTLTVAVP
jgi:hypothetical protein